ncbi:TIGR04372 family glycosyltransferase [Herbaspirillum rhizosphaerae]|uniref:TIGR04372 family glycosyltransferase n=1 Tax=Herbaspirillum rhizosphaerae TaxID=346179 RepID=UPI000AE13AB7|nr:TIGR04372 family glycosyltransferase [Herbaspirillum rhizosphaerae]
MPILHHLLYWLGKLTGTIIILPHPIAIGNFGEELYYGLLKARREKKKLVVLFPYELPGLLRLRIPNREMAHLQSEYRAFLPSNPLYPVCCVLITLYFGFFRGVHIITNKYWGIQLSEYSRIPMLGQELLWKPKLVMQSFSWDVVRAYEWDKQTKENLEISLSKKRLAIAQRQRIQMGLPSDAWFVCLHVREGGYYNDYQTVERNATIDNYIPAIEEITRRGGWVVRIGDDTMKRLPSMPQVIDYPFTPQKSELMDLYLLKECRTYIGMQSGILDIAIMFQRPIIQTNMYSWLLGYPQKERDVGILKHVYSKSDKRFLAPMEWPKTPWAQHAFHPRDNYVFYENTPQELRQIVIEFFDQGADWTPNDAQLAFNATRWAAAVKKLETPMGSERQIDDVHARYRLATRLSTAQGVLGADFLKHYAARQNEILSEQHAEPDTIK